MDRRVRRTKLLIRNTFFELLNEKSLASITITELTTRADVDRRTFYLHYSCIDDILKEIEKETIDAMHQVLSSMTGFDLDTFFKGLTKIMADNLDFWRIVSKKETYHRLLSQGKNYLKSALYDIFFDKSKLSPEDFDLYSEYVAAGIISVYYNWLISESTMSLEELTKKAEIAVSNSWELISSS